MAIIKQRKKGSNTVYVVEALSRYDPEKKQKRYVYRRIIGKLDPVTGEVVPTGKPGRPPKKPAAQSTENAASAPPQPEEHTVEEHTVDECLEVINRLRQDLDAARQKSSRQEKLIQAMQKLLAMYESGGN